MVSSSLFDDTFISLFLVLHQMCSESAHSMPTGLPVYFCNSNCINVATRSHSCLPLSMSLTVSSGRTSPCVISPSPVRLLHLWHAALYTFSVCRSRGWHCQGHCRHLPRHFCGRPTPSGYLRWALLSIFLCFLYPSGLASAWKCASWLLSLLLHLQFQVFSLIHRAYLLSWPIPAITMTAELMYILLMFLLRNDWYLCV